MKQKSFKTFLLSLLLITASTGAFAQSDFKLPAGMELEYSFYHNNTKIGVMQRTLKQSSPGQYVFESHVKATNFLARLFLKEIIERSTFSFEQDRAKPIQYEYTRRGSKNRQYLIDFDWQNNQASDQSQEKTWTLDIPADTVDKHLYQLNVMFDMQNNPESLQYLVADRGRLKTYDIENQGVEMVETPLGELETIKLHRQSEKRSTTVWVAKAFNYLPVVVEQNEKGKKFKSVIKSINGLEKSNP